MKVTTIKESCSLHARIGWQGLTKKEYLDEGDYYLVTGVDFDRGRIAFEKCHYVTKDRYDQDPHIQLSIDDVLVTKDGTIGKVAIIDAPVDKPATLNSGVFVVRPKDTEQLLPRYLTLVLQSNRFNRFIERIKVGCTIAHLNQEKFFGFNFPLPSVEKQKYIISIFEALSSLLDKRQREILALDNLIKARFVEMFGDIVNNSRGWMTQPLGDLCTIVRGGSPRPIDKYLGGSVPWIKIGDATEGESIYLTSTKEHIIPEGVRKSRLVKAGSLIFANCGVSLGFARIITFDGCIHDGWLAMENIDDRLDKVFLLQALNQMTEHFRRIAPAGTQPNLNTAIMKAFPQIIPPMALQKEFIAFTKRIDKSKSIVLNQQVYIKASLVRGLVSVGG